MARATDLLRRAAGLVREKRYQGAVEVYLQATEADPSDSRAWFGLGVCLYRIGNFDVARIALERAQRMGYPKAGAALARLEAAEKRRATAPQAVAPPAPAEEAAAPKIELDRFVRVMLVESGEADRRAIKSAIEGAIAHIEVAAVPYSVTTSDTMSGVMHYDVAVLDWDSAPGAAAGLMQILRIKRPTLLIICLLRRYDSEKVQKVLDAGADFYVVKQPDFASVLPPLIVRWTQRDRAVADQEAARAGGGTLDRWRGALDALGEMLLRVDADYTVLGGNQTAMKGLRRGEDEFVGRSYSQMLHGRVDPPDTCPIYQTLENGRPVAGQIRHEETGRMLNVRAWPVVSQRGRVGAAVVLMRPQEADAEAMHTVAVGGIYRGLIEGANVGILMLGAEETVQFANAAFCAMVGRTLDDLIERTVEAAVPVREVELLRECIGRASASGGAEQLTTFQFADGRMAPAEIRAARFNWGGDEYLVLTFVEVAPAPAPEPVEAPAPAGPAGDVEAGLDGLACGIVALEADGRVMWLNSVAAELFGADRDTLVGNDYLGLIGRRLYGSMVEADAFIDALAGAHARGETLEDVPLQLRRDGEVETTHYWSTRVRDGASGVARVEHFYPAAGAPEAVAAAAPADESRRMLDAVPDILFTADAEGRITWCNAAARATIGYGPDELAGMKLDELAVDGSTEPLREALRAALEEGQRGEAEVALSRNGGGTLWVQAILLPAPDGGTVDGVLRDISHRKLNESIRDLLNQWPAL